MNTLMGIGWTIGVQEFDSQRGLRIFLFTYVSRTALGSTQPLIQWVPGALSLGVKRPGREVDHSPPCSADVKSAWSYTSTPPLRLHGVMLTSVQRHLCLCLYIKIYCRACFWVTAKMKITKRRQYSLYRHGVIQNPH
jgi:hypothetical protein